METVGGKLKMKEVINVVIGASKEYSLYAPVLLISLFENNMKYKFVVYYYYNEELGDLLQYMSNICDKFENEFTPMYVSEERLAGTYDCGTWHNSTWYRYLCLEDLRGKCDRVLILGTDIVVHKDISEFYFQDLEDKFIAAVQDSVNMYEWYVLYDECKERNKSIQDYVNADVMLVDVLKAGNVLNLRDMLEYYENEKVYCMDQGVLNYFYSDYIKIITDYNYNFGVNAAFETLNSEEYINMVDSMSILHFAGRKPWDDFDGSYAHNIWMDYCKKTPFYESIRQKLILSLQNKKHAFEKRCANLDRILDVMDQLWTIYSQGNLLKNLRKMKLNNIIIYGYGRLGKHFLEMCLKCGVDVECVVDVKKVQCMNIPSCRPEGLAELKKIYPIIVTAICDYELIKKQIKNMIDADVISLEELL